MTWGYVDAATPDTRRPESSEWRLWPKPTELLLADRTDEFDKGNI
jgi:hypothetical protein